MYASVSKGRGGGSSKIFLDWDDGHCLESFEKAMVMGFFFKVQISLGLDSFIIDGISEIYWLDTVFGCLNTMWVVLGVTINWLILL